LFSSFRVVGVFGVFGVLGVFVVKTPAAKTIHRSQGDAESRIVVNFDTTRAIPRIHYVGLSRVTTVEGLYITNLCENKIAVSPDVQTEMKRLQNSGHLNLSVLPLYTANSVSLKICYLNARSLHRHIEDCQVINQLICYIVIDF